MTHVTDRMIPAAPCLRRAGHAWPLAALGALSLAPAAHAQTAESEGPEAGLEEIVVTARRREEALQDTPIAVSAFTAEALERRQIAGTEDLDRITPNLQFTSYGPLTGHNSAAQVFIRGIGQTDASAGVDPGVGLYIDDVYMGRSVGGVLEFRDIANVQVLRGPQGTLFGRNTIGGAVLLTTELPGEEFGGKLRFGVGDEGLWEVFGALDVPIAEGLGARVSAGARQRDGYVQRIADGIDLGDEDTYTLQGSLRWAASEAVALTLRADYTEEDENGSPFVFAAINETQAFPAAASVGARCPGATFPPPSVPVNLVDSRCANDATWNLGPFTNGGTALVLSTLENWGVSATLEWELNETLTFKSISAYRELAWRGARDADNTPFTILHTDWESDGDQASQELQLLVETGRLNGVLGAFYFEESYIDFLQVPFGAPPPRIAAGGPANRDYQRADVDNDNWALFAQWGYELSDAWAITAGVRYTEETKGIQIVGYTIDPTVPATAPPPPLNAPFLNVQPVPFEQTFDAVTGSASIQYDWSEDVMTYLSWSQGFKSGGFNQRYNAPPPGLVPIPFEEENAETFELGLKSELGGNLRLNAAIFTTDYDDLQLTYRLGIVPLLFNAGKASIDGAELELAWAPGRLIVEGSVGYLDDAIESISVIQLPPPSAQPTATVGPNNTLPFTPEWQVNFGAGYAFPVGNGWTLTPRADVSYTAEQFFDAANSTEVAQLDDYTVASASLALESPQGSWRIRAGVENLTDELYLVAGNSSFGTASGYGEVIYARPRNYFVTATYQF